MKSWMRPELSWRWAKLALPMMRLAIMRPATFTRIFSCSRDSPECLSYMPCSSAASASRWMPLGKARPRSRSFASFSFRSWMMEFASCACSSGLSLIAFPSDSYKPCFSEASMNGSRAPSNTFCGSPVLDAGLVQHVGADLAAPADVGLAVLQLLLLLAPLLHLHLVHLGLQHLHGGGAVLVLGALALAGHHDAAGDVGDADGGIGLVHVLAAGALGTVGVHPEVRRIDLALDLIVHFRRDEHRREGGVAGGGVEGRLAHQAVHTGLGAQPAVGIGTFVADGGALDARHFTGGGFHELG